MELETTSFTHWENIFQSEIEKMTSSFDPSHDMLHLKRVVATAKKLASHENADLNVIIPAAWLHDFVVIPKDSPLRKQASQISSRRASEFLHDIDYPERYINEIAHAIESHSFSAGIFPRTLEAKIVQDADRLDALGSIGIARCFITSGRMQVPMYHEADPLCVNRQPDDQLGTVDHFYTKLFRIAETLHTPAALKEGKRRVESMKNFLSQLDSEIG